MSFFRSSNSSKGKIGPHNYRELELMQSGEKPAALFTHEDLIDPTYQNTRNELDKMVENGQLVKDVHEVYSPVIKQIIPYYIYTQPEESWRIKLLRENRNIVARPKSAKHYNRAKLGLLLGYSKEDVAAYSRQWFWPF